MLDLVRLSRRELLPPGGAELYRQIGLLTRMKPGDEVLDVACSSGAALEFLYREFGIHGSGVDFDPELIERASQRTRDAGVSTELSFQQSGADTLPYRDEVFDVSIGEVGLTAHIDPETAVGELVRVTRRGGSILLVQPVWKAPVDAERRGVFSDYLGVETLMLVEWKRLLKEAGVEALHTEDWSDEETAFRPLIAKPFPDFAELFSIGEKLAILGRAWSRWGWRGVREAVIRERKVHRLLTRERVLGLDLIKGLRAPEITPTPQEALTEEEEPVAEVGSPEGLPLFDSEER